MLQVFQHFVLKDMPTEAKSSMLDLGSLGGWNKQIALRCKAMKSATGKEIALLLKQCQQ